MGLIRYNWQPAQAFKPWRPGEGRITAIILHSSDGHEAGDIATLTGPRVSAHWYVTRAGAIWHFVDDGDTAYHAGRVTRTVYDNAHTLGIEQEHIDNSDDWTDAQIDAVANLTAALFARHGVMDVKGHKDICRPPGRKVDPVAFPWADFRAKVHAASAEDWDFKRI